MTVLFRRGFHIKIDAVIGHIGVLLVDEVLRDANHIVHVFRTTRVIIGSEDVQRIHVFVVGLDVLFNQRFPISVEFVGSCYDFVVNVGEILDIVNIVPTRFQPPMNQVKGEVTARMAKMTAVVHGYPTNVHRDLSGFKSGEIHLFSSTSVVQADGHGLHGGL